MMPRALVVMTALASLSWIRASVSLHRPGSDLMSETSLAADDECAHDEDCGLHALQLRTRAKGAATETASKDFNGDFEAEELDEEGDGTEHAHRRRVGRRRIASTLYQATPDYKGNLQPYECNGTRLHTGHEGCCDGMVYDLANQGCCGSVPYRTDKLSCCRHTDDTSTVFDPYSSNCCDDDWRTNKEGGICVLEYGQTSCCTLEGGRRRRRGHKLRSSHRMHAHGGRRRRRRRRSSTASESTTRPSTVASETSKQAGSDVPAAATGSASQTV